MADDGMDALKQAEQIALELGDKSKSENTLVVKTKTDSSKPVIKSDSKKEVVVAKKKKVVKKIVAKKKDYFVWDPVLLSVFNYVINLLREIEKE